jgi:hypothetical protein
MKVREGEFRSYDFSTEEILAWAKKFLSYVGYELLPPQYIGFTQPDIHAKRGEGEKTYEIVAMVGSGLGEVVDNYAKLSSLKTSLGEKADYVLILPPVNEYLLIEFLTEDKGRWFYEIKDREFMMWLGNPQEETMWCILGSPRDNKFNDFFIFPVKGMSFDAFIAMRLAREEWEE